MAEDDTETDRFEAPQSMERRKRRRSYSERGSFWFTKKEKGLLSPYRMTFVPVLPLVIRSGYVRDLDYGELDPWATGATCALRPFLQDFGPNIIWCVVPIFL